VNPRAEAFERIGGRFEARVLEPSPPAVGSAPWYADDPVARGDVPAGRQVVSPVGNGDLRWDALAQDDAELAEWCADRWLGAYRQLPEVPESLVPTRLALHALAERVISPARRKANTKIGLRYTRGGFGTPFYGADVQVRVAGTELIVHEAGAERRAPITTLDAAADHVGRGALPDDVELGSDALEVDPGAAAFLGEWYGFAASVLEELRAGAGEELEPSRVQLWPEHFDLALELGAADAGARAAYGLSPGDEVHPEPYLYVAPWVAPDQGDLWQASAFKGAELSYVELLQDSDQRSCAFEFFSARLSALTG
jgi:hypothetical protein